MLKNKVGLEAEFILRNSKGDVLYPGNCGFSTDDFIILGEIRGIAGESREETLANFLQEYYKALGKAKKDNRTLDLNGWSEISPQFYSEIMTKMEKKTISPIKNIYNIDMLTLSDAVVEDGVLKYHKISTGLHIHFSSSDENERTFRYKKYDLSKIKLPLSFGGTQISEMEFDHVNSIEDEEVKISSSSSRITQPVLYHIIKEFDEKVLPQYQIKDTKLKYRNPGFYELKPWGFEYRSLPFSYDVLNSLYDIVDFAYIQLEELEIK